MDNIKGPKRLIAVANRITRVCMLLMFVTLLLLLNGFGDVFAMTGAFIIFSGALYYWHKKSIPEKKMSPMVLYALIYPAFIVEFTAVLLAPLSIIILLMLLIGRQGGYEVSLAFVYFIALIICLSVSLYACFIRRSWLTVRSHSIPIEMACATFNDYKIIHLSDLHIGNLTSKHQMDRWIKRVNQLEPDLILLTGDYVTFGDYFFDDVADALSALKSKDGIYCCSGNHDFFTYNPERLWKKLGNNNITLIDNDRVTISRQGIDLVLLGIKGVVDNLEQQRECFQQALQGKKLPLLSILLAHDPSAFPIAVESKILFTLSGHTHGGQFAIPFNKKINLSRRRYPFNSGLYRQEKSFLHVSSGMGVAHMPMRIGTSPEIGVITLVAESHSLMD